jgi:hypothetical protein
MSLNKMQFYLVVIAFMNFVATRIFGDDRIPVKEGRNSDIERTSSLPQHSFISHNFLHCSRNSRCSEPEKNVWERQEVHRYIHNFLPA